MWRCVGAHWADKRNDLTNAVISQCGWCIPCSFSFCEKNKKNIVRLLYSLLSVYITEKSREGNKKKWFNTTNQVVHFWFSFLIQIKAVSTLLFVFYAMKYIIILMQNPKPESF